jgi:hypothetical protein
VASPTQLLEDVGCSRASARASVVYGDDKEVTVIWNTARAADPPALIGRCASRYDRQLVAEVSFTELIIRSVGSRKPAVIDTVVCENVVVYEACDSQH